MKIFGVEHIIYLVVSMLLTVAGLVLTKKFCKSKKAQRINVLVTGGGGYLLILILNRVFCVTELNDPSFFPYSACAVIGFALCICTLVTRRNSKTLLGLSFMAILTGLIATVYPTYLPTNSYNGVYSYACTITSLIHHSLAIYMPLMMLITGYVKIDIKRWASAPIAYCVLIVYGLFAIKIIGRADAMLINNPILPGTIFNWFYLGLIFLALYTVFLFVYDGIVNKSNCQLCQWWKMIFSKKSKVAEEKSTEETDFNCSTDDKNKSE